MPLTQAQMIEQMQEARAAHQEARALRHLVLNYCAQAKQHYRANLDLQNCMDALTAVIELRPIPDDRITFDNERFYKRHARKNDKARERQRAQRRMRGVPSLEDSHAMARERESYAQFNAPKPTGHSPKIILPDPDEMPDNSDLDAIQNNSSMGFGFSLDTLPNTSEDDLPTKEKPNGND